MHELEDLKKRFTKELEEYGKKDKLSAADVDVVDKMAHALAFICDIIKKDENMNSGYSSRNDYSYHNMNEYPRGMRPIGGYSGTNPDPRRDWQYPDYNMPRGNWAGGI